MPASGAKVRDGHSSGRNAEHSPALVSRVLLRWRGIVWTGIWLILILGSWLYLDNHRLQLDFNAVASPLSQAFTGRVDDPAGSGDVRLTIEARELYVDAASATLGQIRIVLPIIRGRCNLVAQSAGRRCSKGALHQRQGVLLSFDRTVEFTIVASHLSTLGVSPTQGGDTMTVRASGHAKLLMEISCTTNRTLTLQWQGSSSSRPLATDCRRSPSTTLLVGPPEPSSRRARDFPYPALTFAGTSLMLATASGRRVALVSRQMNLHIGSRQVSIQSPSYESVTALATRTHIATLNVSLGPTGEPPQLEATATPAESVRIQTSGPHPISEQELPTEFEQHIDIWLVFLGIALPFMAAPWLGVFTGDPRG